MNSILCFGEALWDCLPEGRFVGGAPLNVAFHLNQLGRSAFPISAVGGDLWGRELIDHLHKLNVDTRFVSIHPSAPTGTVTARLDAQRNAHYTIHENVAWDFIPLTESVLPIAAKADAVIYGTLSQRSDSNRLALGRLLNHATEAYTVYDVNLRPPHDSSELVWKLTQSADLIKLNDTEIMQLMGGAETQHSFEPLARQMAAQSGASAICITAGEKGAGLLYQSEWFWADAKKITVADTVGAGDAFLAALVASLLAAPASPHEALHRACRLGEFVASQPGATPRHLNH